MLKEFKEFIVRGNALELAIGVVIGGAFNSVVTAIVKGFITPIVSFCIKFATNSKDGTIEGVKLPLGNGESLDFGAVLSAIISFLITMFVLFVIVKAMNKARELGKTKEEPEEDATPTQEDYLKEIVELLRKEK